MAHHKRCERSIDAIWLRQDAFDGYASTVLAPRSADETLCSGVAALFGCNDAPVYRPTPVVRRLQAKASQDLLSPKERFEHLSRQPEAVEPMSIAAPLDAHLEVEQDELTMAIDPTPLRRRYWADILLKSPSLADVELAERMDAERSAPPSPASSVASSVHSRFDIDRSGDTTADTSIDPLDVTIRGPIGVMLDEQDQQQWDDGFWSDRVSTNDAMTFFAQRYPALAEVIASSSVAPIDDLPMPPLRARLSDRSLRSPRSPVSPLHRQVLLTTWVKSPKSVESMLSLT